MPSSEPTTVEWRLCSDGVSSPHRRVISEEEAERIQREGILNGTMNGLWLERREVTDWERVHG